MFHHTTPPRFPQPSAALHLKAYHFADYSIVQAEQNIYKNIDLDTSQNMHQCVCLYYADYYLLLHSNNALLSYQMKINLIIEDNPVE